jgi:tRNA U34 5-carboxymethylaminomethyl modifying GTPase MnmE/TrmE
MVSPASPASANPPPDDVLAHIFERFCVGK